MGSSDFVQAQHTLLDPLVEPDPSDETGLNSHFQSTFAPRQQNPTPPNSAGVKEPSVGIRSHNTGSSVETNPYRKNRASTASRASTLIDGETTPNKPNGFPRHDYPSPPNSASPRREHFSNHRSEAFGSMNTSRPRRSSQPSSSKNPFNEPSSGLTRGGSLRERYPGDTSHRPLDTLRKDDKRAHRAPHLRKKNFQGADVIDRLDKSTLSYHHEGPYDAASFARNKNYTHSPVAAVKDSNEEALRATPRENIIDSVTKHRPLEGTANIPPGVPDRFGRVLNYEEGSDMQRDPLSGGDYRQWPGVKYHPDDLKGKGEPFFSIDKAIKDHKQYGDSGVEMTSRSRNRSLGNQDAPESVPLQSPFEDYNNAGLGRSNTTGKSVGGALKKRFGSLRRRRAES